MRILAISDIHNNVSCVNKLRAQESNRFDVVVVAGDMGSETAQQLLQVLCSFRCPVLYVYGNWDNMLDYEAQVSADSWHLHLEPAKISGFTFAGFSGCPTHWGRNPFALQIHQEVDDRHHEIVRALKDAAESAKWAERVADYTHAQRLAEMQLKVKSHQSTAYRAQLAALEQRRAQDVDRAYRPEQALRRLRAFRVYEKDQQEAHSGLLAQNRAATLKRLTEMEIDPATLILVTHERLGHINDQYPGTFMHLYGHLHGFKHTKWQGTHCINVSVLDKLQLMVPRRSKRGRDKGCRYANAGTYTVIEIASATAFVESVQLRVDYPEWKPGPFVLTDVPLLPEETHFGPYQAPLSEHERPTA